MRYNHSCSSVMSWHQRRNTHSTTFPTPIPTPTSTSIGTETDISKIQQLIKLLDISTALATLKQHPEILYSHDSRIFELFCDASQSHAVVVLCEYMLEEYDKPDQTRKPSFLAVCEGMRILVDRKRQNIASRFGRLMWMEDDKETEDMGQRESEYADDLKGEQVQNSKMKRLRIDWESTELSLHQLYASLKVVAAWCDSGSPQIGIKLLRDIMAQVHEHKDMFTQSKMTNKMHLFKMGCEDAMNSFEQTTKIMGAFEVVKLMSLINPDLIDSGTLRYLNRILIADCSYIVSAFKPEEFPVHNLPEAAFFGRSNVGKSSLVNSVLGHDIAKVSKTPGKTKTLNFFRANKNSRSRGFFLVDLPGYGYARVSSEYREAWRQLFKAYLSERKQCRIVFQLVDVTYGILQEDRRLIRLMQRELTRRNLKHVIVFTKADLESSKPDLLERRRQEALTCLKEINSGKRISSDAVLFTSAKSGLGVRDLWTLIIRNMIQTRSTDKGDDGAMWEFLDSMRSTAADRSQEQAQEADAESSVKKSETGGRNRKKGVRYHPKDDNIDTENEAAASSKPILMTEDDPTSWKLLVAELEAQESRKKEERMKRRKAKVQTEEEVASASVEQTAVDKALDTPEAEADKSGGTSKTNRKSPRTSSSAWHEFESEWEKIKFSQDDDVASSSDEDDAHRSTVRKARGPLPTTKARRKIRNYKHLA